MVDDMILTREGEGVKGGTNHRGSRSRSIYRYLLLLPVQYKDNIVPGTSIRYIPGMYYFEFRITWCTVPGTTSVFHTRYMYSICVPGTSIDTRSIALPVPVALPPTTVPGQVLVR